MLEGIEDMEPVIDGLVAAGPDALLLSPGQAGLLQRRPGRDKPALVLRLDVPDIYGREHPDRPTCTMVSDPVELAVRLDAACVVLNLLDVPGKPSLRQACLANVGALRSACDRAGMPLMVEPVPLGRGAVGLRRPARPPATDRAGPAGRRAGRGHHQGRPARGPGGVRAPGPGGARPAADPGRRTHRRDRAAREHRGGARRRCRRARLRAQRHPAPGSRGDDPRAARARARRRGRRPRPPG